MPRQPFGCSHLVMPGKRFLCVLSEFNIERPIGVNTICGFQWNDCEITAQEIPAAKGPHIGDEVADVIDVPVLAKGDIEFAGAVEPAKSVKARSIPTVKQCGGL